VAFNEKLWEGWRKIVKKTKSLDGVDRDKYMENVCGLYHVQAHGRQAA
jgi:hypothetical protein